MKIVGIILFVFLFSFVVMGQTSWPEKDFPFHNEPKKKVKEVIKKGHNLLIFVSADCPFDNHYTERINNLVVNYPTLNVLLINSNSNEINNKDLLEYWVTKNKLLFPMVLDGEQVLSQLFSIRKSTHAVLISNVGTNFRVLYSGAIDNNPQSASQVTNKYLEDAINQAVNKEKISVSSISPMGCMIR